MVFSLYKPLKDYKYKQIKMTFCWIRHYWWNHLNRNNMDFGCVQWSEVKFSGVDGQQYIAYCSPIKQNCARGYFHKESDLSQALHFTVLEFQKKTEGFQIVSLSETSISEFKMKAMARNGRGWRRGKNMCSFSGSGHRDGIGVFLQKGPLHGRPHLNQESGSLKTFP